MNKLQTKYNTPYRAMNRSRMHRHEFEGKWYETGAIATQWGFVVAYMQEDWYSLAFIWMGREHTHTGEETISERALVLRARRFANQIVGEQMVGSDRADAGSPK